MMMTEPENAVHDKTRRKRLLVELEKYGAKIDPETVQDDDTLDTLLQILKGRGIEVSDVSVAPANRTAGNEDSTTASQWYESILSDYIWRMTIATVSFFATYPWAALWWPPFYFYSDYHKKAEVGGSSSSK